MYTHQYTNVHVSDIENTHIVHSVCIKNFYSTNFTNGLILEGHVYKIFMGSQFQVVSMCIQYIQNFKYN